MRTTWKIICAVLISICCLTMIMYFENTQSLSDLLTNIACTIIIACIPSINNYLGKLTGDKPFPTL